ncbi:MAG: hypothetical protein ACRC4T_25125 [Cetobacterium sp.]
MIKFDFINGDAMFTDKNIFETNKEYEDIAQRLKFKLLLDRGDWYLENLGIPWSFIIFKIKNKKTQEKEIEKYVKKTIEADKDFKEWISFDLNINERNRSFEIKFVIKIKNDSVISVNVVKGGSL